MKLPGSDLLRTAAEILSIYEHLSAEYRIKFKSLFTDAREILDRMKTMGRHEREAAIDHIVEEMRRIKAEILGKRS